ncbi:ETC complex I subunit conserved region-domain-containing protein [Coprinopsis sp. MPI-PUGE-AT-0042]|nr:ETC complex I subunit conserved region-domain-containing protein [Coprinopsis sp. MPI-PUGE-AT-0042]
MSLFRAVQTAQSPPSSKESAITTPLPESEILAADIISGAPAAKTERWRIDFDILPGSSRWENPLMGWASSADYMQATRLSFRSKEDAAHFAEKQGKQATEVKRIPPKNYAENYVYKPHKLRIARTK